MRCCMQRSVRWLNRMPVGTVPAIGRLLLRDFRRSHGRARALQRPPVVGSIEPEHALHHAQQPRCACRDLGDEDRSDQSAERWLVPLGAAPPDVGPCIQRRRHVLRELGWRKPGQGCAMPIPFPLHLCMLLTRGRCAGGPNISYVIWGCDGQGGSGWVSGPEGGACIATANITLEALLQSYFTSQ